MKKSIFSIAIMVMLLSFYGCGVTDSGTTTTTDSYPYEIEVKDISNKQYLSIIKFIEREREFRSSNRDQIYLYFSPLIEKEKPNGNTLSEFLQQS